MPGIVDSFTIDFKQLDAQKKKLRTGILKAQRETVTEVGRDAELALEAATAAAGLGKLAKAWNRKIFPKNALADDPVALLYPKGGERTRGAIRSNSIGGPIRGHDGMLAVPTPSASLGPRKQRPTPEEWELATGIKLIAVERMGKPTILIAAGVRQTGKTGRIRAASDSAIARGRFASAVIFVLMPVLNAKGRFSIERTVSPFRMRMRDEFVGRAKLLA